MSFLAVARRGAKRGTFDRRVNWSALWDFTTGSVADQVRGIVPIFSRADATQCATRIDNLGVMSTVPANVPRIEHSVTENKLRFSEDLSNAAYGWYAPVAFSGFSSIPGPGGMVANVITSTSGGAGSVYQDTLPETDRALGKRGNSVVFHTSSTCVSAVLWLHDIWAATESHSITFNPTTGAYIASLGTGTTYALTDLKGGWWRLTVSAVGVNPANNQTRWQLGITDPATCTLVLSGVQNNDGDFAGYVKTLDAYATRVTTPEGLRLEPEATNVALHSADFSGWSLSGGPTKSASGLVAPDGGVYQKFTNGTINDSVVEAVSHTSIIGQETTVSMFVARGSAPHLQFGVSDNVANFWVVDVDLTTMTLNTSAYFGGTLTPVRARVKAVKNGWRVYYTFTFSNVLTYYTTFSFTSGAGLLTTVVGQYGYACGVDDEVGIYLDGTSHIPTTTAPVTRAPEVLYVPTASLPSIAAGLSALVEWTQGADDYIHYGVAFGVGTTGGAAPYIHTTVQNNGILAYISPGNNGAALGGVVTPNAKNKLALRITPAGISSSLNGGAVYTSAVTNNLAGMDKITFGQDGAGLNHTFLSDAIIQKVGITTDLLSDAQLVSLSS